MIYVRFRGSTTSRQSIFKAFPSTILEYDLRVGFQSAVEKILRLLKGLRFGDP